MSAQKQQGGKGGQKSRKTKVSRGEHGGGGKVRLNTVQKVLLGGGLYRTWTPDLPPKTQPWRGVDGVIYPAYPEQARENKRIYPHLFAS